MSGKPAGEDFRLFWSAGCVGGFLAVATGAFAAHALEGRLPPGDLEIFETATRYMMFHALALLGAAWAVQRGLGRIARAAGYAFIIGIVLFSGSLYALVLVGPRAWGAVTPFGGVAFLTGWVLLALAARAPNPPEDAG